MEKYTELIENLKISNPCYREFRVIEGHGLCDLRPFIYTIGLCCSIDETNPNYIK